MAVPAENGSLARVKDTYELAINYEQKFPTAFAGRSLNRTDCVVVGDELKKRPDEGKRKALQHGEVYDSCNHIFHCAGALLS